MHPTTLPHKEKDFHFVKVAFAYKCGKKFPKVCFEKSIGIQYWADLATGQFVGKCWYLDNFYSSSGRVFFGISSDREDNYF